MAKRKKDKRILVLSDLHCGSLVGLTPPVRWLSKEDDRTDIYDLQREMWSVYRKLLKECGAVDILFVLGDAIDGKQARQGSRGLITADVHEQGEMAVGCLMYVDADQKVIIGGTEYHVGVEDEERNIAKTLEAEFALRKFVDVNGCVFDLRHWIPGSSIPHGRWTALAKDVLWNDIWTLSGGQPKADVTLRGHVHYYIDLGQANPDHRAMIMPGLQAPGGLHGTRKLSSTIDWGMVWFDVDTKGNFEWTTRVVQLENSKVEVVEM